MRGAIAAILLSGACLAAPAGHAATYNATPANYQGFLGSLQPGDVLNLAAGTYPLLQLGALTGTEPARITIQGPATGSPAIVTVNASNPDCCNIVQLTGASFVSLRNLTIDSAMRPFVDGLKANGTTHHIEVIDCTFVGQGSHQQTVAISTKGTAWNWVVRGNTITEAGTGMYFGNSDGTAPFVNGIVENNLVVDTIGYNAQVKFQVPYTRPAGLGPGPHVTIIRDNVFIKRRAQGSWNPGIVDGGRPNLLVGGFPTSGFGTDDLYVIHGNFFFQNMDGEPLVQASGRVAAHDNILVGGTFRALSFVNHDLPLRRAYAYNNTIFNTGSGIVVSGGPLEDSRVSGNLIFATTGVTAPVQQDNIVDTVGNAPGYVTAPTMTLGVMNFFPYSALTTGPPLDMSSYATHVAFNTDFNGASKGTFTRRGAYAGQGANPGWALSATRKPYVRASLVDHYYQSILRRAPDAGGKTFWEGEADRVSGLGANINETWFAMAMQFYASAEYLAFNRNNNDFVTDLYTTFFNRSPDSGGLAFWNNNLSNGMPREVALAEFMFSTEFRNFTQALFGNTAARAEVDAVIDFYRGLLSRLPDNNGFTFWRDRFRAAQCQNAAAVTSEVEAISSAFALSAEYTGRNRTNAQYVGDLYNAFLRRGGDLGGVQFWIGQLNSAAQTREQLRVQFKNSPEFQARVNAIVTQGCFT